jgi:glycerophosphoryl diester phosphodiesterase
MTDSSFMAIAHRGASSYAPENTFAAFDLALSMGARHIELDVEATRDGHIVVIHDDAVDRTTDGSGTRRRPTLEALQALDAGSWFGKEFAGQRIRCFRSVLSRYKGASTSTPRSRAGRLSSRSGPRIWCGSTA